MSSAIFVERFNELLLFSDCTENDLHKKTGLPLKSIYNWTRGYTYPCPRSLFVLADFFHVSVDYILGLENDYLLREVKAIDFDVAQQSILMYLNNYIQEKQITKYRLAKLLETKQTAIKRWFEENAMPKTEKLIAISKLLDKSLEELLGRQ